MENKHISIKFCGGCNPRIDRGRLAKKVRETLDRSDYAVSYNRMDADFIIYISGCSADCARRYSVTDKPHVTVAGAAIDAIAVNECELVIEIISKVRDYFERLEKDLQR